MPERIVVIGVAGDGRWLNPRAQNTLTAASLVVGGERQLEAMSISEDRGFVIGSDVSVALNAVAAEDGLVCVVASGDPGFFGILRQVSARFGPELLEVHPAPSSVAMAFARIGMPWDDCLVVSAHGRPLDSAAALVARAEKVAVLVSPDNPPEALGKALVSIGVSERRVVVCTRLDTTSESVVETDLRGLAGGTWDPVSVVILMAPSVFERGAPLAWGLPDDVFEHRSGMITKSEVRAIAMGKLELSPTGVLWDVGAGSASVAIEAARLAPGLAVFAIERDTEDAARARNNALVHSVQLRVIEGEAPGALDDLPDPDRAFVGGGGKVVLDEVMRRLRPGGRVVATFTALDRAAEAYSHLGNLLQVGAARGEPLPDGGIRLAGLNPVFIAWGPTP